MTYVQAQPRVMATAAADVAAIGSTIHQATTDVAGRTTAVAAAAADEISAALARLFSAYGQEWRALIGRAAALHAEFARALAAAGDAY
ncbi:PE family protein, partial [Mycobacterium interjectum]|uniref:PE family protein n=1 Tax=Mycobacterium interjectum TaxID=33895 RepID=UPI0021F2C20F